MTTLLLSAGLRGRRCILTVILIASMLFGPTDLIAQTGCVGPAGETQVAVDLIRDALGTPIVESTDKTRREYAHITSGLRDALGLTVPSDPDDDVRPQIRVIVETDNSGLRSTANFTVESVITDSALRVEIYDVDPGEGSTDEDSGTFKLFGAGGFDAAATLNVHAAAPSRSEVDDNGTTTVTQNFCEPDVNHAAGDANEVYGFFEEVTLGASRDFALLVPHGGLIEEETEAQVAEMAAAFAARNQPFNAWLATAHWDDDVASELFHITSKATDPQTYPGLDALLDAGDFDSVDEIEFQYAASLHGFGSFDRPGLVLGGRAPQEIKCYVARQIQQRLISEAEPAIAYYVYDSDGDSDTALDLPDGDDVRITDQRPDVGLTGRSCDNIVNRFTQDSGCDVGHGGIQIEESAALRDDAALRQLVSEEIANGFIDMILDPNLVDPASTTWCDALETTATAGPGQIGDRVWVDLDNNGVQDPGEAGREGVAVELLETGVVVASTTTSASGQYLFTDLPSATYTVRFTAPSGFTFSPASGGDEATDSDALAGGETGTILIDPGVTRLDVDAGLHPDGTAGQIGDFVWQDDNGDGVQDAGEAGLAGVQVDLTTALGTAVASTTSDTNGAYLFTGLLPGDYVVTFSASDWVATTPSHVGPFPLAADAVDLSRDAGFKASCDEFALVAFGSDWKYPGTSGAWSSTWNQDTFDDSSWTSGAGLLGFSESTTVHTTVPNGSSTVTYYFRHTF
ncbi:MAG: SdrD B-like domain-containing protein, partial [Acidobacteriota bacterium]